MPNVVQLHRAPIDRQHGLSWDEPEQACREHERQADGPLYGYIVISITTEGRTLTSVNIPADVLHIDDVADLAAKATKVALAQSAIHNAQAGGLDGAA